MHYHTGFPRKMSVYKKEINLTKGHFFWENWYFLKSALKQTAKTCRKHAIIRRQIGDRPIFGMHYSIKKQGG